MLMELYEKIPVPLKTEHNWRYSEYSFFVKDEEPTTFVDINSSISNIHKSDIFEPLVVKNPEKIGVYNLIKSQEKFSFDIDKSGMYFIELKMLGKYNVVREQVRIRENLDVDLVFTIEDGNKESVNNNCLELLVEKNSKVRIFFDHNLKQSFSHSLIYFDMKDNTDVRLAFLTNNPKYEKTHIKGLINGSNSKYVVFMLARVDGLDHVDYRTENIHIKPGSESLSVYRSIVDGRARSIYTGMLRIEKEAKFSNAYQNSRNILLSDKARVETIPELEILNQEVACTHGAVVSSLDEEAIYYFMSRGVSRQEAIKLITDGFLLDKLEDNLGPNLYPIIYNKVTNDEYS